jgi:hypothetical protein
MRLRVLMLIGVLAVVYNDTGSTLSGQSGKPPSTSAKASQPPSKAPTVDTITLPNEFRELFRSTTVNGQSATVSGYSYRFASGDGRAVAIFIPRSIPRDDVILVNAISDVVRRTYGVDLSGAEPRLVQRATGNVIAFDSGRHTYNVLTIKGETREGQYGPGEPHTFLIWRERQ